MNTYFRTRECIVTVEGNDLTEMRAGVEKVLGPDWIITGINAEMSMIDVSGDLPEWLPGPWRAKFTAHGTNGSA